MSTARASTALMSVSMIGCEPMLSAMRRGSPSRIDPSRCPSAMTAAMVPWLLTSARRGPSGRSAAVAIFLEDQSRERGVFVEVLEERPYDALEALQGRSRAASDFHHGLPKRQDFTFEDRFVERAFRSEIVRDRAEVGPGRSRNRPDGGAVESILRKKGEGSPLKAIFDRRLIHTFVLIDGMVVARKGLSPISSSVAS